MSYNVPPQKIRELIENIEFLQEEKAVKIKELDIEYENKILPNFDMGLFIENIEFLQKEKAIKTRNLNLEHCNKMLPYFDLCLLISKQYKRAAYNLAIKNKIMTKDPKSHPFRTEITAEGLLLCWNTPASFLAPWEQIFEHI